VTLSLEVAAGMRAGREDVFADADQPAFDRICR